MSRRGWIITLVLVGVALALVLGVAANSQSRAETQYCDSLGSLQSAISSLTALNPSSASQSEVQSDVDAIQSAWSNVKSDGSTLHDDNQQALDSAWSSFQSAVGDLSDGGSTADVQSAAEGLGKAVQSSLDSYDCSSSTSTS